MKCVLTASGRGGHLLPAIKISEVLKKNGHEILFMGSFANGLDLLKKKNLPTISLDTIGFSGYHPVAVLKFMMKQIVATIRSVQELRKYSPDVILGFGGYSSVPVILAAAVCGYPRLIHEQNVVPGKANKFLSLFAQKIAVSFPATQKFFDAKKSEVTGYPSLVFQETLDKNKVYEKFQLDHLKTTILVFGGSQGSRRVNDEFLSAAKLLKGEMDFQVIHASGESEYERAKEAYKKYSIKAAVFSYLDCMHLAYSIADLVISRAGAGTIAEISLFEKKSILIPYPYAGAHQRENALYLCEMDSAIMIEEDQLTAVKLKDAILRQLNQDDAEESHNRLMKSHSLNASESIVNLALGLTK